MKLSKTTKTITYIILSFTLIFIDLEYSNAVECKSLKNSVIDFSLFYSSDNETKDVSENLQHAIDCLIDKAKSSKTKSGILILPPGKFRIDKLVKTTISGKEIDAIAIKGSGMGVTVLQCNNSEGCLSVTFKDYRTGVFQISDMRFEALKEGSGIAIKVSQPEGGNQHRRNFIAENIEISNKDGTENYFDYGIYVLGSWRPLISNVLVTGPFGPKAKNIYKTTACFSS